VRPGGSSWGGASGAGASAGRAYAGSARRTAAFAAVAGWHYTVDLGGGAGFTIDLPPTADVFDGTEVAFTIADPGANAVCVLAAAPEAGAVPADTIYVNGVESATLDVGDLYQDHAVRLVKRSGGWDRVDRALGSVAAANVINTGNAFVSAGGLLTLGGWGGVTLAAYGELVQITGTTIVITGGVYYPPQAAPAPPDDGGAMWFDEGLNAFCVMGPDGNTYTVNVTLVPP